MASMITAIGTMDSVCDACEQIADWRLRNREGGIEAAACKTHKHQVREAYFAGEFQTCENCGQSVYHTTQPSLGGDHVTLCRRCAK